MAKYRRVTYVDRCQIHAFLQAEYEVPEIAKKLQFDKSTIYRELDKSGGREKFCPDRSESLSKKRILNRRRKYKIHGELEKVVNKYLWLKWSPEQISGRLSLERGESVSHQTIYEHVFRNYSALKTTLRRYNKRGAGRYRMRRCRRENSSKLSIRQRPRIVDIRKRIGDWERDTMRNKFGQHVLVCTDRKSRYTKIAKLSSMNNDKVSKETKRLLKNKALHTITNDNGAEFKNNPHLLCPVYYCEPRRPQQRGTVENMVGLLRYYIKRKHNLNQVTLRQLAKIEHTLNYRPRRCLDFRTPHEVFYGTTVALVS